MDKEGETKDREKDRPIKGKGGQRTRRQTISKLQPDWLFYFPLKLDT